MSDWADTIIETAEQNYGLASVMNINDDIKLKLNHLHSLLISRLKSQYALLLSEDDVNKIKTQNNNIKTYLDQYQAYSLRPTQNRVTPQHDPITNIKNTVSTLASILAKIPIVGKGETTTSINKIATSFNEKLTSIDKEVSDTSATFKTGLSEFKQNINELTKRLSAEEQKISTILNAFQEQFSKDQNYRNSEFLKHKDENFDNIQKYKSELTRAYQQHINELTTDFDTFKHNQGTELTDLYEAKEKEADGIIEKISTSQVKAEAVKVNIEELFGIVSGNALMGSQQKYANKAQKSAQNLFRAAIFSMLLAIFVAILVFQNVIFEGQQILDWKFLTFRFSFVILCLLPAVYCMNESRKQKNQEYKFRDLEVKMEALPAYFSSLNDCNEVLATRLVLAEKILSPEKFNPDDENKNIPLDTLKELIDLINIIKS